MVPTFVLVKDIPSTVKIHLHEHYNVSYTLTFNLLNILYNLRAIFRTIH